MPEVVAAPSNGDVEMTDAPPAAPAESTPEEVESETLYIQNLNEKIKVAVMKQTLTNLFKTYGDVLDVVAHSNIRMRGQAFVSFKSKDVARKALKEVKGFPLYSKPMQVTFAKTRSDAVVKVLEEDRFDEHKKERLEHKRKQRFDNPHAVKARAKRKAEKVDGAAPVPTTKRPNVLMPDEYLPPNKILFIQNLPEDVNKDQLTTLFAQYPNLYEVRLIPTKKDIAFVEYADEGSASVAKDALHNYKIDGETKIKVTFARK
ncbi:RNA-binding domain-containing protein [Exidia glandulosa HHB12029]|uniref:RNA-binding domain-containing protein n=1 Tax=Exidia glandulosa HHB12029 TaxID=1314781 RepID=A0A165DUN3_EXIGL|nr:RNA-binding domain-containing protein [Exidia glandulosa HHB12029]